MNEVRQVEMRHSENTGSGSFAFDIRSYEAVTMFDFADDERKVLAERAFGLTEGFAELDCINTEGIEPLVTVLNEFNILREDFSEKLLTRDEILANAPEQFDGCFQVPL